MPKADNPHAIRLYNSLLENIDKKNAEGIAYKIALSKSADINKKFLWAESICDGLESEFDDDTIKKIRMGCACGPEMGKMRKLKKIYHSSADLNDFIIKSNDQKFGFTLWIEENDLLLSYPECYCSCVKRIDRMLPKTWCYCTLGYTKRMFEHVFECEVDVELLESIKIGGDRCVIKVVKK